MVSLLGNTNLNKNNITDHSRNGRARRWPLFDHHKPHDDISAFAQCLVLDDKSSMIDR